MNICKILFSTVVVFFFTACSKETATVDSATINDYYPLQVGKYAIYQLDSTIYVSFGQVRQINSHIIKDTVAAQITDNAGRLSYRILRLMRGTADTSKWMEHATYMVTPLSNSLEVIENNLRFIKLQLPLTDFFSWNGNRYLPDDLFPEYGFNSTAHSHLGSWEYTYENVNSSLSINGKLFDSTITVSSSITDSAGFPPVVKNAPAFKTVWEEKYAKGVGLISKYISLEEFQPSSVTYPNGYYSGFALKQKIIAHN